MNRYDFEHSFGGQMGYQSTDQQDYDMGYKALQYYHARASEYPNYEFTIEDLISSLGNYPEIKIQGIGLGANVNDMSESDVEDAMFALADQAAGKIPDNFQTYTNALMRKAQNPSFISAVKYTVAETASDVAEGAVEDFTILKDSIVNIKDTTLGMLSFISKYSKYIFPVVAIGAGWYFISKAGLVAKTVNRLASAKNPKKRKGKKF